MIDINRSFSIGASTFVPFSMKIIGIGGAGCGVVDRLLIDGIPATDLVAINTDSQVLSSSVASQKIQLGYSLTHGLGAGGDPEVGMAAAQDAIVELHAVATNIKIVFVVAGLGGGTGSGATPFMAHAARAEGSVVIGIVTLPFSFEGRRRQQQAMASLDHLRQLCHAVICFENDRMSELVPPKAGIQQAFLAADQTLSECVRGIRAILARPGIMKVGVDNLLTVLSSDTPGCLFGYGEGENENRCHEALAHALRNPLMDRGKLLSEAASVLVHISGANNLTLAEVEIIMGELNRHVGENTHLFLGTTLDPRLGQKLTVTLISSLGNRVETPPQPTSPTLSFRTSETIVSPDHTPAELVDDSISKDESVLLPEDLPIEIQKAPDIVEHILSPFAPAPSKNTEPIIKPVPSSVEKVKEVKQEILQFEPVSRGRFEKSEPTIIEGHDLDIPTVLRKGFRV